MRRLVHVNSQDIIICIRVDKVLVNQRAWGDDARHLSIMHEAIGLDLVTRIVGELLGNSYVAVELLNQDFEEPVKLEEREASLRTRGLAFQL